MKVVMLMFDSLNRHFLPPYHPSTWAIAPNFQRLAERTLTFDHSYVCSMPCMPARRELHTGRSNFLHAPWSPLEPYDFSMPEALKKAGVYTHLTTDHYHYFEDLGANYATRYQSFDFVRGQEGDPWIGQVAEPEIPDHINGKGRRQDWVNRPFTQPDARHYQTRTLDLGLDFLERNHAEDRWFLQIECFDPHEPFCCDPKYRALYPQEYDGPLFDWPGYRGVAETPEQIAELQRQYAALLSKCDESLGRVLDAMDRHGLWEETMFVLWTDHGFLLGEHQCWAKNWAPLYREVAQTPFFLWDPRSGRKGERRESIVQPALDLAPTLLEFFDQPIPPTMRGRCLRPVIEEDEPVRAGCIYGYHGSSVNYTDGRFVYVRGPVEGNQPLASYTLQPNLLRRFGHEFEEAEVVRPEWSDGMAVWKVPRRTKPEDHLGLGRHLLYDLESDPTQEKPLRDAEQEARCCRAMAALLEEHEAPAEQFTRLQLEPLS